MHMCNFISFPVACLRYIDSLFIKTGVFFITDEILSRHFCVTCDSTMTKVAVVARCNPWFQWLVYSYFNGIWLVVIWESHGSTAPCAPRSPLGKPWQFVIGQPRLQGFSFGNWIVGSTLHFQICQRLKEDRDELNWQLTFALGGLLTTEKRPDCPLFSTKPVFKAF